MVSSNSTNTALNSDTSFLDSQTSPSGIASDRMSQEVFSWEGIEIFGEAEPVTKEECDRAVGFQLFPILPTRNSKRTRHYKRGRRNTLKTLRKLGCKSDASVQEINGYLAEAEECDRLSSKLVDLPRFNGFEPYSLRQENACIFKGEKALTSEVVYTRLEKSFTAKNSESLFTEDYTVQVGETLDLIESENLAKGIQHNMIMELTGLSRGMLYAIACLGNQLIHRAASSSGLLERNGRGETCVSGSKAAMRFVLSNHQIWNPIGATVTAAKQFWSEVNISGSRSSVRRTADWLRDRGFLHFEGAFVEGIWGKGREYFGINMARLLLLLECVEQLLGGYKALPRHRMSFVQKLFVAVFGRPYNRSEASDIDLSWKDDDPDKAHSPQGDRSYAKWSRSQDLQSLAYAEAQRLEAKYGPADTRVEDAWLTYDDICFEQGFND